MGMVSSSAFRRHYAELPNASFDADQTVESNRCAAAKLFSPTSAISPSERLLMQINTSSHDLATENEPLQVVSGCKD